MLILHSIVWTFLIGVMALGTGIASCQNYPNKSIRIVTSEAGGSSDIMSRMIAQEISGPLGQPVIVENRGGIVSGEVVSRASPDGYTMLSAGGTFWMGPLLRKVPYDPVRDFSTIAMTHTAPYLIVTHPSLPVNSIKELIALAKERPGALNYGSGPIGSSNHLAAELFKAMARVNIVHIAYKGTSPALNDLIGARVQLMFANTAIAVPHLKSGKLRALAVTSAESSPLAPGMSTVAASGLPGYESALRQGLFAPARTPAAIIALLNQKIVRFLNRPEIKQKLLDTGVEAAGSTPEQFSAIVKSEMATMGRVIKDAGIRAE